MSNKEDKTITFFWGHSGCGKTTSLVKYACRDAVPTNGKTIFLTNDDFSIGAKSKLKTFTKIMGIDYKFLSIEACIRDITALDIYDSIFFDLYTGMTGELAVNIDKLLLGFTKHFIIKKIFVINALLLPYNKVIDRLSGLDSDEVIITFVDYFKLLSLKKCNELENRIIRLSDSLPVWISNGPLVPDDLFKYTGGFGFSGSFHKPG